MRAASILVAFLVLSQLTPESQKLLDAEIARQREVQLTSTKGAIKRATDELERGRRGTINTAMRGIVVDSTTKRLTFPSAQSKQRHIALNTKALGDARKKLAELEKDGGNVALEIEIDRMEVGHIGNLVFSESVVRGSVEDGFEVIQVIDDDNMIVKMFGKPTWIANRPTRGLVDGRRVTLPETFLVSGTKTYKNVAGSSSTVFVLEQFPLR